VQTTEETRHITPTAPLAHDVDRIELEVPSEPAKLGRPPSRDVMRWTVEWVEGVQPGSVVVWRRHKHGPARGRTRSDGVREALDACEVLEQLKRTHDVEASSILHGELLQVRTMRFDSRLCEAADRFRVLIHTDGLARPWCDVPEESTVAAADVEHCITIVQQLLGDRVLPAPIRVVARPRGRQKAIEVRPALIVRREVLELAARALVEERVGCGRKTLP
jgi:hypothetical protein